MSQELEANESQELLNDDIFRFDNGNILTVGKLKELFRNQYFGKGSRFFQTQKIQYITFLLLDKVGE